MGNPSSNRTPNLIDKGIRSRKFILTIVCIVLLIGMTILCGLVKVLQPMFATFVGGLLGILGLYFGGNVANKYAIGKTMTSIEVGDPAPNIYYPAVPYDNNKQVVGTEGEF